MWDEMVFTSNTSVKHQFTYNVNATPSLDNTGSSNLTGGQGSVSISGSMFGTSMASVKVYLKPVEANIARKAIRRSMSPMGVDERSYHVHRPLNKKVMSDFFSHTLKSQKLNQINWKVGGSGSRNLNIPHYSLDHLKDQALHTGVFTLFEDDHPLEEHTVLEDEDMAHKIQHFVRRHKRSTLRYNREQKLAARGVEEVQGINDYVDSMNSSHFGSIDSIADTSLDVTFSQIPAGDYNIIVYIDDSGNAANSFRITSQGVVSSVSPGNGSTYGGQEVTITGQGFHPGDPSLTTVMLGGNTCEVTQVSFRYKEILFTHMGSIIYLYVGFRIYTVFYLI